MNKGLKIARLCQLLGALAMVGGIVKCSGGGLDGSGGVGGLFLVGLLGIIGGKVYEFMTRP